MTKVENQCVGCDVCYHCGNRCVEVVCCDICEESIDECDMIETSSGVFHKDCIADKLSENDYIEIGENLKKKIEPISFVLNPIVEYGFDEDEINKILLEKLKEDKARFEQAKSDFYDDYSDEICSEAIGGNMI